MTYTFKAQHEFQPGAVGQNLDPQHLCNGIAYDHDESVVRNAGGYPEPLAATAYDTIHMTAQGAMLALQAPLIAYFEAITGRNDGEDCLFIWFDASGGSGQTILGTVINTNSQGRVVWNFPAGSFTTPPVVQALPVDGNTGDALSVNVSLEAVSATQMTVRVWRTQTPVLGLALLPTVAVGAGVPVHLIAKAS